ncbi:YopX family protein [Vagococcus carniphilus]|uniref:YopX family protein n=1 Tax=Vagococcus carniphilus TaxID=218144 RepID=UPI00289008F8|nr:YopX family protein [Vagococcus carniphilus]MDT2816002.1 YopX family protein [Vagococcus carniphilus]
MEIETPEYRAWLLGEYGPGMANVTEINWVGNFIQSKPYVTVDTWCELIDQEKVVLMKNLHWQDKNGIEMFENDITELIVDEEIRRFIVREREVEREVSILTGFIVETQKMKLKTIVFEFEGNYLLPCVDEDGICDTEKMTIIGNIYENPELLPGIHVF